MQSKLGVLLLSFCIILLSAFNYHFLSHCHQKPLSTINHLCAEHFHFSRIMQASALNSNVCTFIYSNVRFVAFCVYFYCCCNVSAKITTLLSESLMNIENEMKVNIEICHDTRLMREFNEKDVLRYQY